MKHLKKFIAAALTMFVALAMAVPALAAGTNSITVEGAQEGETYSIYKMLDLAVHENPDTTGARDAYDGFTYIINDKWSGFWTTGAGKDYIDTNTVGTDTYVVWKDSKKSVDDLEAFGKAAAAWAEANSITTDYPDVTADASGATFSNIDNGYYLITSTYGIATTVGSTPNNADQTIMEKNTENSTEKKVEEAAERNGAEASWGSANDAAIGDTITFRSKVTIAKNSINVVYHDTMSAGLDWSGVDSVKVYTDEACETELAAANYTVAAGTDPETFTVSFENSYVASLTEATDVYVKYTAVLNDDAVVAIPETNTAKVTWGDAGESTSSSTETSTHKFDILKYDGTDTAKNPLANAKFQLFTVETGGTALNLAKNAAGTIYRVVDMADEGATLPEGYTLVSDNKIVTLDSGNITIEGVDSDDYWLEETDAPTGFNKLTTRVKVQVEASNNLVSEIENLSGTELPSTGGMGTTILYIIGGILVVGGGIYLLTKKRMGKE